jgi:hypothetical protein
MGEGGQKAELHGRRFCGAGQHVRGRPSVHPHHGQAHVQHRQLRLENAQAMGIRGRQRPAFARHRVPVRLVGHPRPPLALRVPAAQPALPFRTPVPRDTERVLHIMNGRPPLDLTQVLSHLRELRDHRVGLPAAKPVMKCDLKALAPVVARNFGPATPQGAKLCKHDGPLGNLHGYDVDHGYLAHRI